MVTSVSAATLAPSAGAEDGTITVTIHSAKTSRTGTTLFAAFVTTTDPIVVTGLDEGLMRVT
jgi:hypothetical protein